MVRTKKYMNKTRLIPFLGLAALLAACKSDEPAPSTTEAPFSILEAKTYLPVEAGSSTVRLDQAQGRRPGLDHHPQLHEQ